MLAKRKGRCEYFAIKVLKKDVVLGDDVKFAMIEKKVLAFGYQSPFLTHLHSTFTSPVSRSDHHCYNIVIGNELWRDIKKGQQKM